MGWLLRPPAPAFWGLLVIHDEFVSLPVYESIIAVGHGLGELGLIERNENIVPFLTKIQHKFVELSYFFDALAPQTGDGIFSRLLRTEALTPSATLKTKQKQTVWRMRACSTENKIKSSLKNWLSTSMEQQRQVIEALTNQHHFRQVKVHTDNANTLLKSRLFEAIFNDEILPTMGVLSQPKHNEANPPERTPVFKINEDRKATTFSQITSSSEKSSAPQKRFTVESNPSFFSRTSDLTITQLEVELLNIEVERDQEKEKNKILLEEKIALNQYVQLLEKENLRFRLRLNQIEILSKTLVEALKVATRRYEQHILGMNFVKRFFSSNGLTGVHRAKQLEKTLLTYIKHNSESSYKKVIIELNDFLKYMHLLGGNLNNHSFRTYLLDVLKHIEVEHANTKKPLFAPAYQHQWNKNSDTRKRCLADVVNQIEDVLIEPIQGEQPRLYSLATSNT